MRKFIYLSILVFCGACSYHFDVKEIAEDPKLVLYSFPGNQDTTFIQVSKSIPMSSKQNQQTALSDTKITFCVNGEEKEVQYAEKDSTSIPQACYYVLGKFYPGNRIEIKAEAENLPAVSSRTEIPSFFPLKKIKLVKKFNNGKEKIQFQISLQDDPSETNYYGIIIERMMEYWNDDTLWGEPYHCYIITLPLELDEEPLLRQTRAFDELFWENDELFHSKLCIFSDDKINGQEYTLHLNDSYSYQKNYVSSDGTRRSCSHYRITVLGLSADYYLYARNIIDLQNNELGRYGLSPLRPAYTNIQSGLGILGGYSIVQSEWLENL